MPHVPDTGPGKRVPGARARTEGRGQPSNIRGGSRMQESCTYGSMRGAPSNGRPYRNRCPADSAGAFIRRRVGSSIRRNRSIGFAEADNCPDDTAAPTVDRPQTQTKPRHRYLSRAELKVRIHSPPAERVYELLVPKAAEPEW